MHVYARTYTCTYTRKCAHTHIHTRTHTRTHAHTYTYSHTHAHTHDTHTHTQTAQVLKWEWPSPVGTTRPLDGEQSGGERFPHLVGGITREMVVETYDVKRSAGGEFLSIEGLC